MVPASCGDVLLDREKCDISVPVTVPARPPRLIASDLDGTLLSPEGLISERTRRALSGLAAAGVELVFVTARPPRWVDHLADVVGGHGTVLCVNGEFVYDVPRRTVIEAHGMPPATVRAIAADLRRALPGVGFAAELPGGIRPEREYPALHPEDVPPDDAYWPIEVLAAASHVCPSNTDDGVASVLEALIGRLEPLA